MTNIWNLCYPSAVHDVEFDFGFFLLFFSLVSFDLGGAIAAALKSEAAVDGNGKEVADRGLVCRLV